MPQREIRDTMKAEHRSRNKPDPETITSVCVCLQKLHAQLKCLFCSQFEPPADRCEKTTTRTNIISIVPLEEPYTCANTVVVGDNDYASRNDSEDI